MVKGLSNDDIKYTFDRCKRWLEGMYGDEKDLDG